MISFMSDFIETTLSFFTQFNTLLSDILDFFDTEIIDYSIFDVWISLPVFLFFIGAGLVKTFVPVA